MPKTPLEIAAFVLCGLAAPVLYLVATGTYWPLAVWALIGVVVVVASLAPEDDPPYQLPESILADTTSNDDYAARVLAKYYRDPKSRTRLEDAA